MAPYSRRKMLNNGEGPDYKQQGLLYTVYYSASVAHQSGQHRPYLTGNIYNILSGR